MRRVLPSRPVALAIEDGVITDETTVFDYGCGRGTDLLHLHQLGIQAHGWDPAFRSDEPSIGRYLYGEAINLGTRLRDVREIIARLYYAFEELAQRLEG